MNVAAAGTALRHRRSSLPTTHLPPRRIRKRPRHPPTATNNNSPASPVLAGVVACLSGQTAPLKSRLESLVRSLGGVAVRDFDPLHVTHLILDRPCGNKYDYVRRNREREFARRLHLVASEWVERCREEGRRVDEEEYRLNENDDDENDERGKLSDDERIDRMILPKEIRQASLVEACEWTALRSFPRIFFSQHFLLVGFDHVDDSNPSSIQSILSALIRRAGGTVYWTPNDFITVVVLGEEYSEHQWEDVRSFCRHHPRGPMAVTASWILSSLYHCTMQAPPFPPVPCKDKGLVQRHAKVDDSKRANLDATVAKRKITVQSNLFDKCIFVVVRPKPPHGTMSFDKLEMESIITTHGGLLLTHHLFGAIQTDLANASKTTDRKFHLLSTGGYSHDPTNLDPLLAQLSKLGAEIIPVTPVWIKACVGDRVRYDARRYPLLFQPPPWPVRLLPPRRAGAPSPLLLVSLTGFIDASRYGIIWMLKEIGAGYTDNLTAKNTHLICKDAAGKKYEKACEWGLHVVSVEWLYHVMRYGYKEGCEREFSLRGYEGVWESDGISKKRVCSNLPSMETCDNDNDVATKAQETLDTGVAPHASTLSPSHNGGNKRVSSSPPSRTVDNDSPVAPEASEKSNSDVTHKPPESPENVKKRLHSALQSLETSNPTAFLRRSQRRRIPVLDTENSSSSFTPAGSPPHDKDEELEQSEPFTIRVDAHVGATFPCAGDGGDVPISQLNDAEDMGESQVVWFAERRAR
ncbi:hypothetical protein ACHAW6_009394 [Cyclotella cf. meneghiniana]